ncbi:MAG TPA: hypothetical protein VKO63_00040, partial [Chitinispirillaceae bacterium]|nr:hypothetical protein [Chitinispirillaceae bacterium]
NDLQEGPEITYDITGNKIKEEYYTLGIKNGTETGYDESGRKIYESQYLNGKKNGTETFYDYSSGDIPTVTVIQWIQGEVAP